MTPEKAPETEGKLEFLRPTDQSAISPPSATVSAVCDRHQTRLESGNTQAHSPPVVNTPTRRKTGGFAENRRKQDLPRYRQVPAWTRSRRGLQFMDESGQRQYVWQTSWGVSTRLIGGIIMTHGDDAGLLLPPQIAPIQVIIVPIWKTSDEKAGVLNAASSVENALKTAGIKVKLDNTEQKTPGWKFNFWEMKGVPLRIEIGPRDVSNGTVVICRRDVPGKQGKVFAVSMESSTLIPYVKDRLDNIQSRLLEMATTFRDSNIVDVVSYDQLRAAIAEGKWARGPWSASDSAELRVKEETGATIRCYPFDQPEGPKTCLMTGNPANEVAIFAKSY